MSKTENELRQLSTRRTTLESEHEQLIRSRFEELAIRQQTHDRLSFCTQGFLSHLHHAAAYIAPNEPAFAISRPPKGRLLHLAHRGMASV